MAAQRELFNRFIEQVGEDWRAHLKDWTQPGFRAVAVYRLGVWSKQVQPRLVRGVLCRVYRVLYRYVRNHYGIELPETAVVGRRLVIGHQGGTIIHPYAVIGDDCLIRQNVTIGATSDETAKYAPTLGNKVQVGCGAAIIGKITIGDGVRIGPNAVVMTNVPAGATAFAMPARIITAPQMRAAPEKE
jgi:serine O-acetyltransferase